jgi:hypothetical protein
MLLLTTPVKCNDPLLLLLPLLLHLFNSSLPAGQCWC